MMLDGAITSLNSTVLDTVEWEGCIHLSEALHACMFMTKKILFPICDHSYYVAVKF